MSTFSVFTVTLVFADVAAFALSASVERAEYRITLAV
jgi:hypothetical protein